ncbi:hypothetical protein W97_08572 [Coniosporium apollinis CBS 100218]|uniref:Adhesin domain-containing protein n=1 Tax=Coniosporium apollinis (strain CBS 100218) TaxID=1168221 RepID=R7Z564_CONA1|nr:uncharacterized protein W97_08572 [Coniosporium apollinis CBS 100218]EON69312.1 hypothetical protein W97_08572 [Coniosporium apollinis CBS 100218]
MASRRDQDVSGRGSITDSPTDGYFNRRQHPRDLYVATPASSIAELEGDAAVRYAGSSDSSPSRSQVIYTPTSTARSGETTPLLERDAPPAYTAVASAPVPAVEKPTAPTFGLFDSARASKRENAGGADDLGESGLPTPTVRRPCCRRPCAASGGTSKRQILLFVRLFVGIVGTLLLVGLLFPDHRDEAHRAPGVPERPIESEPGSSKNTESRRTIINVGSGSVSGAYALRDYLSIRTTSGSISITVDPQAADPNYPKPAVFEAYATAGSIRIDFPTRGAIPDRVYEVAVHSDMGSISGTFIHGQHTSLSALSGSISATILPYSAGNRSALRTDTMSGQTTVTVLAPYKDPGTVMGSMESLHKSKSGSMKLVYPQEWEGTVEGRTVSGSLRMHGRDLEVVREDKGYVRNHVVARKGKKNSRMEFNVMSGSVTAQIGDL